MFRQSRLDREIADPGFNPANTVAIGYDSEIVDGEQRVYAVINMREIARLDDDPDAIRQLADVLINRGEFSGYCVASHAGQVGIYFDADLLPQVTDRFLDAGLRVGINNGDLNEILVTQEHGISGLSITASELNFEPEVPLDVALQIISHVQAEVSSGVSYEKRDKDGLDFGPY